jgi:hypothetical protein
VFQQWSRGITAKRIKTLTPLMEKQRRRILNLIIYITNDSNNFIRCVAWEIALCNMVSEYRLKLAKHQAGHNYAHAN